MADPDTPPERFPAEQNRWEVAEGRKPTLVVTLTDAAEPVPGRPRLGGAPDDERPPPGGRWVLHWRLQTAQRLLTGFVLRFATRAEAVAKAEDLVRSYEELVQIPPGSSG